MSTFAPHPILVRGRERLDNWGNWSRLDGPDTGLPRKTNFYTPPRTGDTWAEGDQAIDEAKPVVNYIEAEWTESLVLKLPGRQRTAVIYAYVRQYEIFLLSRRLHCDRETARRVLVEAEWSIGRA